LGLAPPAPLLVDGHQHRLEAIAVQRRHHVARGQQRNFVLRRFAPKQNDDPRLLHFEFLSTPSCENRKLHSSVSCSITLPSGLPAPWPALVSTCSRMGRSLAVAACSRAVILRACMASTRVSDSAVCRNTAGYEAPSLTLWYGE